MSLPPTLTNLDRSFLASGECEYDRRRLEKKRPGRAAELSSGTVCEYYDEWEASSFLTLVVVRTPDGKLWGFKQYVQPGEEVWYDDEPLFPVEEKVVKVTTYVQPGGKAFDWS